VGGQRTDAICKSDGRLKNEGCVEVEEKFADGGCDHEHHIGAYDESKMRGKERKRSASPTDQIRNKTRQ